MVQRGKWSGALAASLLVAGALAGEAQRTHEITVEDYFTIEVISDCAVSPDGKYVAFTLLGWRDQDQPRSTDLWLVQTATRRLRRLTFDPADDDNPQWGGQSRFVYFASRRRRAGADRPPYDGSRQVYRVGVDGGEPFPVTRVKEGITGFQLAEDGRTLYYTRSVEQEPDQWRQLRQKYDQIEYGHGTLHNSELYRLDLVSWRERKLLAPGRFIRYFAVSRDQGRIAMITAADDRLITHEGWSRVDVYDTRSGRTITLPDQLWRQQAESPHGWLEHPAWSWDGQLLAFTVAWDGYPTRVFVAEWSGGQPALREVQRPEGVEVSGGLYWRPHSADLCLLADRLARRRVYRVSAVRGGGQGPSAALTPGDVVVHAFDFFADGRQAVAVKSDCTHGRDLFLMDTSAPQPQYARLTDVNPQIATWKLPQISITRWIGAQGDEVQGILELPPDYRPGSGPLPTIVEIHGGPTACTYYRLRYWIYGRTLLAARGYALLSPNYRGSTGYGDKFLSELIGHENDWDVKDILAGLDALVARGIADPQRLGVMGWSNGGLLTNCIITTTTRFKAASSGAGVVDMLMQWGLEDTPGHVVNYMRGLPWEASAAYVRGSAIYRLGNVTTPTIIHVGAKDARVPREHCFTLYRGLKDYVGVPTELLVYPGAGHGLTVRAHRKAKLEWDLAWFDKYVRGRPATRPAQP